MKGNEALAEAAIQAGCRHFFGYPITPQTEVAAYMAKRMPDVYKRQGKCTSASIMMPTNKTGVGIPAPYGGIFVWNRMLTL